MPLFLRLPPMLSPLSDHPIRFLHSCPHQKPTPNSSLVFITLHFRTLSCFRHLVCCRRHNSYTILETDNPIQLRQNPESEQDEIRRKIINESSLATRRIPKFPGSVDFPKPDLPQVDLHASFDSSVEQDRVLKKALEVRRGVASEALKAAFRAGKMSMTYSNNLVSNLGAFVDRIVIGAAAMKADPEFSHQSFNARAKGYIQSTGVVPLVKWLKHNSMTYPQIGKIICKCNNDLNHICCMAEWLKSIHVKGQFLGPTMVKAGPTLLDLKFEQLEENIDQLERYGVRNEWIGYVVTKCPKLLVMSVEELEARICFYQEMGLNERDFGTMVFDYPKALGFFSLEEMQSKVDYLMQFGLSKEEVGRLLAYKPQLMGCSIEERWKPLVKYLYYLGVKRDGMKRILVVKPMVFCIDLEACISPKVVKFLQEIGVREEAIGRVIFLMTDAGVTEEDIGKVIALDPQLVGCHIVNKLDVNVKYFLSLGIRRPILGQMIADFPMLLRYKLDILRPKYKYLRRVMVRPLQDLVEFPRFFSYSLEGRIMPRHEILVKNRVNFKLKYMLASSDEEFNMKVQEAVQRRERFESRLVNSDISQAEETQPEQTQQ
ncbi:mTERF [Carex littledalei]|uniref:mTERF n=1 Tax=Carex littledalei TaxID=544730 RepID=A0A833QKV5_9POAL|nr:mTERF [Carex littledalei]